MRSFSIVLSCLMVLWVTVGHADDKLTEKTSSPVMSGLEAFYLLLVSGYFLIL